MGGGKIKEWKKNNNNNNLKKSSSHANKWAAKMSWYEIEIVYFVVFDGVSAIILLWHMSK